jgi:hypothetical protein
MPLVAQYFSAVESRNNWIAQCLTQHCRAMSSKSMNLPGLVRTHHRCRLNKYGMTKCGALWSRRSITGPLVLGLIIITEARSSVRPIRKINMVEISENNSCLLSRSLTPILISYLQIRVWWCLSTALLLIRMRHPRPFASHYTMV